MRYRLDVVAPSIADAVANAGGWMFDRALGGWEVRVLVPDYRDASPLRILGAEPVSLEAILESHGGERYPQALAISADLYRSDPRIGAGLRLALGDGGIGVAMWGDGWPFDLEGPVGEVEHTLSLAARAFKAKALVATGASGQAVGATEAYRSGIPTSRLAGADLVPAG
ncbi:hypothetical protein [Aldersonia kunmingensis]|uniref:hypothetical protein n=1 Tax=Aldersonia kunmingensis TaxID=408066 RepID=UPI0008325FF2|nr:hypothetical protein [Aldersonia kunmingensis]